MENLKKEAIEMGKQYYEGGKIFWLNNLEKIFLHIDTFEINEEEVNRVVEETGGNLTNRSNLSVGSLGKEEE